MLEPIALRDLRGFIFDMDGVIYRGDTALPGAAEFLERLHRLYVPFLFLTNNATTPPAKVAARLSRMGITADPAQIITSAEVAAAGIAQAVDGRRALVVGEEGLRLAMTDAGFALVEDHRQADVVVAGLDRTLTYARLRAATLAIFRGAGFFATNLDRNLPTEDGLAPGAGAIVAALETATGVKPVAFGKPEPGMFHYALRRLNAPAKLVAAIGDRIDTDIIGAQAAGVHTIAVLTGVSTAEEMMAMRPRPEWVFPGLRELDAAYFSRQL